LNLLQFHSHLVWV